MAGTSYLTGDHHIHGFLWDRGALTDLGTLGGTSSAVQWLNDRGDVVGSARITGNQAVHAYLWRHGAMSDLGTFPGYNDFNAYGINEDGTIVGLACDSLACQSETAFLSEDGGPMVDLNALVYPPSNLHVYWGIYINERGEISAQATDPGGNVRAVLLVPNGDCDDDCEQRIIESQNRPAAQPVNAAAPMIGKPAGPLRNPFGDRFPSFGRADVSSE